MTACRLRPSWRYGLVPPATATWYPRAGRQHGRRRHGCGHSWPALPGLPGPTAAVTQGGITIEPLRDLAGDDALRPGVLQAGIPPCAVTAIDNLNPVMIASVSHLT